MTTVILAALLQTPANPDLATPNSTVLALYRVISGPAGDRPWDQFNALFTPEGKLQARIERNGTVRLATMTPADYQKNNTPYFKTNGFFEKEVKGKTEVNGLIAHVWSSYESRRALTDKDPFERGVNSIQLVKTAAGWQVSSLLWASEPSK